MLVKGIHHVALKCESMEKFQETIKFYSEVLQMKITRKWGEGKDSGVMIDTGNGIIEIFANAENSLQDGPIRHFAFAVDNTDKCIEAVKNAGYNIKLGPTDLTIPSENPYDVRIGFCIGPVGEEIEFFQEK